jgi:hypothetical protein
LQEDDGLHSGASWFAYDSAAYGWSIRLLHRTVLKNVSDGSIEIMLRGTGAFLSDLEIAIVDATAINGAKSFRAYVLGDKDRRFGSDLGLCESNKLVMRVEQDIFFSPIGSFMLTHCFDSFSDVGINEPKHYVPRGKFVFDTLYLGNIAVGDGTVRCDKKENNGLGAGRGKTEDTLAVHAVTIG